MAKAFPARMISATDFQGLPSSVGVEQVLIALSSLNARAAMSLLSGVDLTITHNATFFGVLKPGPPPPGPSQAEGLSVALPVELSVTWPMLDVRSGGLSR